MTVQNFKAIVGSTLILFVLSVAVACHSSHSTTDEIAPLVTIKSPTAGESFPGPITIKGDITDEGLHQLTISVKLDSDKSELFKATPTVLNLTEYTFLETWTPTSIAPETAVTLYITAEDHNANITEKTVSFKVK
jgi:Bacterial Ig domain